MISNKNIDEVISLVHRSVKKYSKPVIERLNKGLNSPFWVLIGTVLSLRTKDEITERITKTLYFEAKTPAAILKIPLKQLEKILYPVGFYKVKAKNIIKISKIILNKYNGAVPSGMDELLALPGVGRKTANLVLILSFDKYGICVDTHVHKIFNRWGYLKTKTPDDTEMALRKTLPKKYWKKINYYLVTFGRNICISVSPLCSKCPLNKLCPKTGVKRQR